MEPNSLPVIKYQFPNDTDTWVDGGAITTEAFVNYRWRIRSITSYWQQQRWTWRVHREIDAAAANVRPCFQHRSQDGNPNIFPAEPVTVTMPKQTNDSTNVRWWYDGYWTGISRYWNWPPKCWWWWQAQVVMLTNSSNNNLTWRWRIVPANA